jgi:transposase
VIYLRLGVKDSGGKVYAEGSLPATRFDLDPAMKTLPQPWSAAMGATLFTGWICDYLKPHAAALKAAHPLMLRAIAASKKKNDRIDGSKICDCLRCDFLPECCMASRAIRERRRTLRYRNLLVRQMVQMKNKIANLLMAVGVSYTKEKLHKVGQFRELPTTNPDRNGPQPAIRRFKRSTCVPASSAREARGSLVPQGLYGIQPRCFDGGIHAKEEANAHGDAHSKHDRPKRNG